LDEILRGKNKVGLTLISSEGKAEFILINNRTFCFRVLDVFGPNTYKNFEKTLFERINNSWKEVEFIFIG